MSNCSVSVAIAGYGGDGVITTGLLLLQAASRAGLFGIAQRSFGPQIRGGESLSLVRISNEQRQNLDDSFDCLILLDTEHVERFSAEIPLTANSVVIIPSLEAKTPAFVSDTGATVIHCEFDKDLPDGGDNIIALGLLAHLLGFEDSSFTELLKEKFKHKPELQTQTDAWFSSGWNLFNDLTLPQKLDLDFSKPNDKTLWLANGNETAGYGALKAGIRFVAAYPITPASSALEWLAPNIEKLGGSLVQAEDELASINMIIGSSFGGVPSMTATSGPGLALMTESIGLAVASETPLLILDVMRGGPSTGIPTKSEQSDLNIALHGLHGDAPHVVTAALSIADCAFTAGWSVDLAESLQTPVIMLSDQAMAQADAIIAEPDLWPRTAQRQLANAEAEADTAYHRYALTESGISPMAVPGDEGLEYTGDGLEHNEHGTPSASAEHHRQQLEKRAHKLTAYNYQTHWAKIVGGSNEAEVVILCWGSISSAAEEASSRLQKKGVNCKSIALRLLAPLQTEALQQELLGAKKILVAEQSYGAQFLSWLRSQLNFPCEVHSLAIPGPLPIRPVDIVNALEEWTANTQEQEHAANC